MSLEALVKAGGNGRYDKVQAAINSLPEQQRRLFATAISDPGFTLVEITEALNRELDGLGIPISVNASQMSYFKSKITSGKVVL